MDKIEASVIVKKCVHRHAFTFYLIRIKQIKRKPFAGDGSERFLHRKAVYDEFDGKGVASLSLAMSLVYNRHLTEEGLFFEQFVKYKNEWRKTKNE